MWYFQQQPRLSGKSNKICWTHKHINEVWFNFINSVITLSEDIKEKSHLNSLWHSHFQANFLQNCIQAWKNSTIDNVRDSNNGAYAVGGSTILPIKIWCKRPIFEIFHKIRKPPSKKTNCSTITKKMTSWL